MEKTVEIPQLHIAEKTDETQTIHGTQTSESMGITPVCQEVQDRVQQRFGRTTTSSSFMREVSVDVDMKENHDLNDVMQLETSQSQFIDRCVQVPTVLQMRVPIATQQQVPMTRKVQKMNMQRQDSSIQGTQQPHNLNKPQQPAEQTVHERERRQREEGDKGEVEREKGEEREKVVDELTDWVKVTRKNRQERSHDESEERNRKSRKVIQIFVKVDGSKVTPMEVSLTDKVGDIVKKTVDSKNHHKNDVFRRSEELKSCEVRDGCTVHVVSRLRGGGKHKDKKGKVEKKQVTRQGPMSGENRTTPE